MAEGRESLRGTFDRASDLYHRARSEYPDDLFDHLVEVTGLAPCDRLLEIGCGTGKATLPLARRGFRVTCIELGPGLASVARRNLSAYANVEVIHASFEDCTVGPREPFHLLFAATAWHWTDPSMRFRKAWELLRPAGHLAFWSAAHVFPG